MRNKRQLSICEHLPSGVVNRMKEEIVQSKKDNVEHGFAICSSAEHVKQMNNENTVQSDRCTGDDCKITVSIEGIKKSCPSNTKDVAFFHTHPKREESFPSFDDVVSMYALGHKFSCIGSRKEIKCFSRDIPAVKSYIEIPSKEYDIFKKQWKKYAEDCTIDV